MTDNAVTGDIQADGIRADGIPVGDIRADGIPEHIHHRIRRIHHRNRHNHRRIRGNRSPQCRG